MKAVFFDIKESEKKFLNNNMPSGIEPVYLSWALTKGVDISKDIKNAEIICVFVSSVLDEEVLKKFTNLKFILTRSVGYSHIDLKYCAKSDIKVFNAPHYGDNTVAEYVFAVLLTTLRHIKEAEEDVKITQSALKDMKVLNCLTKRSV